MNESDLGRERGLPLSANLKAALVVAKEKAADLGWKYVSPHVLLWSLLPDPRVQTALTPELTSQINRGLEESGDLRQHPDGSVQLEDVGILYDSYFRRADEIREVEGSEEVEPIHLLFALSRSMEIQNIVISSGVATNVLEGKILEGLPGSKRRREEYIESLPPDMKAIYLKPVEDRTPKEARELTGYQARRGSLLRARESQERLRARRESEQNRTDQS